MSKHKEKGAQQPVAACRVEQVVRLATSFSDVSFELRDVDLAEIAYSQGVRGIIFRSQPGGGKSHIIQTFEQAYANRAGENVLIRSVKWSDSMRSIMGHKKPQQNSMTPQKRKRIADIFFHDAMVGLKDVVKSQRRRFRTHPRALFTIAEVPQGVMDESYIQACVAQGFLLVDLVADPVFQQKARQERQLAWDSETGKVVDTRTLSLRRSAPPEVMDMAITRADKESGRRMRPEERDWRFLQQVPLPLQAGQRSHRDQYTLAKRAFALLSQGTSSQPLVIYPHALSGRAA